MEMNDNAAYFADIVMEAPHTFSTGRKSYTIHPLTLGKLMLIQRKLRDMGIDENGIAEWPVMEIIKTVQEHRENCLLLLVYAIAKDKAECFNVSHVNALREELGEWLDDEDIATLMVFILTDDHTEKVRKHYQIDKESEAMTAVMRVKSQGGSLSFGGKTILGALIDQACERYGWTVEYVVWGVSYATLRLMLADRVNTVYLSDDERKKVPAWVAQRDEEVIKASKETMEQIKAMGWK